MFKMVFLVLVTDGFVILLGRSFEYMYLFINSCFPQEDRDYHLQPQLFYCISRAFVSIPILR